MRRILTAGVVCAAVCLAPAAAQAATGNGPYSSATKQSRLTSKVSPFPGAPYLFCRYDACPIMWYVNGNTITDQVGNVGKITHKGHYYQMTFPGEDCTFYWEQSSTGYNSEADPGIYECGEIFLEEWYALDGFDTPLPELAI